MTLTLLIAAMASLLVVAAAAGFAVPASRVPASASSTTRSQRMSRRPRCSGRSRERMLDQAYPDALDAFVVSVQGGQLPLEALMRIRPHVHPLIGRAIDDVLARVERGARLADALDALVDALGTRALALGATIGLAERTGLAIAPMIDRIGDDARLHRRRLAEAAARELPVRLAFPLVLCTLPSFVLVAIAPLLIGALSSLRGT